MSGVREAGRAEGGPDATVLHGLRVCVVGDALVAGAGDPKALGWVGRVGARTSREAGVVTMFALGVPGESTVELSARWREETGRRFAGSSHIDRLVLGLGREDALRGMSPPRTRLNLANVLDEAAVAEVPVFVVGPPPTAQPDLNRRVGELSAAFADVCERRQVPYVDTFGPLLTHEDWLTDLAAGDGYHPGQAGYALIAWLVLHAGWHRWLGLPEA